MAKGIRVEHKFIDNNECKYCSKCEQWLQLVDFAKDKSRWDNLRDRCKECRKGTRNSKQEFEYRDRPGFKDKKAAYDEDYKPQKRINQMDAYRVESREVKLARLLRNRLRSAIHGEQKTGSAVRDLGCSIEHFKMHLEIKFYPHPETGETMNWTNWGRGYGKWQIDHIKPFHTFNLLEKSQLLEAVHYSNMQPLWYCDHKKKGTRPNLLDKSS